ncbi:hypothetical protein NPIL_40801 [Nephila pilipes]|uniref:RING-type domain-containing protein n=2 Tax=Nephila pilipes TaxID=299642 RepID=A0A8X6UU80_NEPPI|nr:hypothetical protein NPIL_40801 [Nephila pilipes]
MPWIPASFLLGDPYQWPRPIRRHFRVSPPYKSRLCHESCHSIALSDTHNMKDEETFGSVVFNYRRPNLTEFMDFFVQFRQQLNSLEPSDIVPILSFRQSILDQVAQLVPHCNELDVPYFHRLVFLEPGEFEDEDLQAAAERGHGAVLQAIWTEYGKPKLYLLARTAWDTYGRQTVTHWIKLAQTVLDSLYGDHWPNTIFETPNDCAICLQTMHWAEKTVCGHVFHLHCLLRHMNTNNTCPICRHPRPLLYDAAAYSEEDVSDSEEDDSDSDYSVEMEFGNLDEAEEAEEEYE